MLFWKVKGCCGVTFWYNIIFGFEIEAIIDSADADKTIENKTRNATATIVINFIFIISPGFY
jgi:hypothetical protein